MLQKGKDEKKRSKSHFPTGLDDLQILFFLLWNTMEV